MIIKRQAIRIIGLILLLVSCSSASADDLLTITGKHPTVKRADTTMNFGVSDRNLLALDYSGKYGLPTEALSADDPVVLKILAVKVNFQKEDPDDPRTTGDGTLDLRSKEQFIAEEGHPIDPAPHNNDYFLKHLEALAAYWNVASQGKVVLEYEIFPRTSDSAYQLDSHMVYYAALDEHNQQYPQYGLAWFFSESFQKADQDTAIRFWNEETLSENYDAYMVFHAGADQQNNFGSIFGPDTYADLFTGYIKLGMPFTVDEGRVTISDGVMMPEMVSQDNRVIALNAVMGHEFGHQLGLVDLYDSRTFVSAVGDFALMDNNGFGYEIELTVLPEGGNPTLVLVQGVMPIFPCAWSRAYLGFSEVVEVTNINNINIAAAELDTNANQILLVPINADEYYLIENRRTDLDGDNETGLKGDLGGTEVIMGPRSPDPNKPELNREYDFLIPGSGMLIWHIDESVVRMDYDGDGVNNFDDNQLQWFNFHCDEFDFLGCDYIKWDNHRQFVKLIEADGVIDFGREYFSGFGRAEDMFEINGNSVFGPNTNPATIANNNAYTGITIDDISAALLTMSCDIKIDGKLPGWPHYIGRSVLPLTSYDLDNDGSEEIITAVDNYILAYKFDGSGYFTPYEGEEVIRQREVYYGDGLITDTLAVFGKIAEGTRFTAPLAVADINLDGFGDIVGVTSANTIVCFTAVTVSYQGEAFKAFDDVSFEGSHAFAPVILDYNTDTTGLEIVCITDEKKIVLDKDGNFLTEETTDKTLFKLIADSLGSVLSSIPDEGDIRGAAAANFDREAGLKIAEVFLDGTLKINYLDNPISVDVGGGVFSDISLGDIDNDGYVEILFCGDNLVYAYNFNGTPVTNFPITVNGYIPTGPIRCNPTLADLNGDGRMEIFIGTANGEVAGFDTEGRRLPLFPKAAGGTIDYPPVFLSDGTNGGLFVLSTEGEIYGYQSAIPVDIDWNSLYGSSLNWSSYTKQLPPVITVAEAIGYLYNYPNPVSEMTTVRFNLKDAGIVQLRLYNMAGDLVFESEVDAEAGVDNEYLLNCSSYAPGVYFCQIETESGDRKFCSIAILK